MLQRINQKIYGIAVLFIVISLLTYGGIAFFLDQQTEAAEKEQAALIAAGDFITLRQQFSQLRAWELMVLLNNDSDAENHFMQTIQSLKKQLALYSRQNQNPQTKSKIDDLITATLQYEDNLSQMSQNLTIQKLLETDIETTYQSIESAALNQGDSLLLRKIFLLNHFQVGYLKKHRPSGYQALKVVLGSTVQAFVKVKAMDERIRSYISNYENSLKDFSETNADLEHIRGNIEKSYKTAIDLFDELSKEQEYISRTAIVAAKDRRSQLKNVMYLFFPFVSIVMFLFSLLLAKKIVTPINTLLETINGVKSGNSRQRFPLMGNSDDELNQLGLSFNSMLDTLDDQQSRMLGFQTELTRNVSELAETNEQLHNEIVERKAADKDKCRLEEQLRQSQKMEAIGTMAGGIAHDFNNLLAIIGGNLDLLQLNQQAGQSIDENLENIREASSRAKNLVAQILAFSRQEQKELVPVNLTTFVGESLKFLRPMIPTTVEFITEPPEEPLHINADTTQLQQVLINLCSNALHAMDEKGLVRINLEEAELTSKEIPLTDGPKATRYAKLSVSDTGKGMDRETLNRIFDPFFTTKGVGEGTGMGLSVVHGIIEQHGGFIQVDSTPGQGTTFTLYFPTTNDVEVTDERVTEATLPTGTESILLVDDEQHVAKVCGSMLGHLGYSVTIMTSSVEALDHFKAHPDDFDLVITDQTMPEMSGVELAKELLKIKPNLPIILCSGYSSQVNDENAREIGINAFCMKPVDMKQLATVARETLDSSKSHQLQSDTGLINHDF